MARTKSLIVFPHLNDYGGDLTKKWYVEYAYYLPEQPKKRHLIRTYDGLCSGTVEERHARARVIINSVTEWLKSGQYLTDGAGRIDPVKLVEQHRPEAREYKRREDSLKVERLIDRFLSEKSHTWSPKTKETYVSKLRYFAEWVYRECNDAPVTYFDEREKIIPFFSWVLEKRGVCRLSVEKYMQIVRTFFYWLMDQKIVQVQPVVRIPKMGKVIDCAPVPFNLDDRARLKAAIEPRSPWLWLACELQFYCAIRPGTEIRLLKVGDIDRERGTVTIRAVNAKADRTESVILPAPVLEQMEKLGIFNYAPELYVFGRYGVPGVAPLGKNTQRNQFNRYREQLGISKDKKFYSWKHTGACSAIDAEVSIFDLQDHLRHKNLETTLEYVKKRKPRTGDMHKWVGEI